MRCALALVMLAGCGSSPPPAPAVASERVAIVASEGAQNAPAVAVAAAEAVDAGVALPEDMITVAPGFLPDPIVRRGSAGGPRPAEMLSEECRGYIGVAPSHVLKVDAVVPQLRVLVHTEGDATLVVQLANGGYLCNDDSEGLNPILEGFPPGRHRIWVGTYSPTPPDGLPYTLAVTTQPIMAASIAGAAPTR